MTNPPQPCDSQTFQGDLHVQVLLDAPDHIILRLRPELSALEGVESFLRNQLQDLSEQLRENLILAVHELLENAFEHGCRFDPTSFVVLDCEFASSMVRFRIIDPGLGFHLNGMNHAAVTNPPDQPLSHVEFRTKNGMRPGGYGLLLVQKIADELTYNSTGNEVTFTKYLNSVPNEVTAE